MTVMIYIWMALAIFFSILEGMTLALVSIWFIFGATAALLGTVFGLHPVWQLLLFVGVSSLLLILTKPITKWCFPVHFVPTNADRALNSVGKVVERIDSLNSTGAVYIDGKTWSASSLDGTPIPEGTLVRVSKIEGVKLYVETNMTLEAEK